MTKLKKICLIIICFCAIIIIAVLLTSADTPNNTTNEVIESKTDTIKEEKKPTASVEKLNALAKAKLYSDTMHMSKAAIYDQLTSEYGEKFDKKSAQYAIDNLKADYKYNALQKAKTYQTEMNMSKKAIYEQLISEYGEKFTKSEAQYAIDNLEK